MRAIAGKMAIAVAGAAALGVIVQPAAAGAAPAGTPGTAGAGAASAGTAPAGGKAPALPSLVAYVRGGDIFVSRDATEKRLTTGGGHARPQWSPDGRSIAYLRGSQLWVMGADGSGQRRLTTRAAAGPSWAPDGKSIAFSSLSCTGGPGVYRIAVGGAARSAAAGSTAGTGGPQVLFPRDCRTEDLPDEPEVPAARTSSTLTERLSTDDAVAWSPDGKTIAFRGGDCDSVYDACLSLGRIATGVETTVAAYGGGSLQTRGFAVVPTWRADGRKLAWTAYQKGETAAHNEPVHLVEYDVAGRTKRTVGGVLDREMAYLDSARAVVTGQYAGGSWVMVVGLSSGVRTPFHSGSQPSVQPVR